jgi:SET and MYND domain-containing protein
MPSIHSKALKSYSIGDIIIRCEPIVQVLNIVHKEKRCDYCHELNDELKKCSKCKQMFYCNQNCQKNDWICGHKYECDLYKEFGDQFSVKEDLRLAARQAFERLLIRLYLLIVNNKTIASKEYQTQNNIKISFNDLETRSEIYRRCPQRISFFIDLCKRFEKFGIKYKKELLFVLFCKLNNNMIGSETHALDLCREALNKCSVKSQDSNSDAIYVPLSGFSHSCVPNSTYLFNGRELQLRAVKPIDVNQEITYSRVDLHRPKAIREEKLYFWSIDCKCIRCETDFDESIDFSKMDRLETQINYFQLNPSHENRKQLVKLNEEMIKWLKSIHNQYDPYIIYTELQLIYLKFCSKVETKKSLKTQSDYIQNLIKTMYGFDHPLYEEFKQLVQSFK